MLKQVSDFIQPNPSKLQPNTLAGTHPHNIIKIALYGVDVYELQRQMVCW